MSSDSSGTPQGALSGSQALSVGASAGSTRTKEKQAHLELAGVVKGVHAKLRKKFRECEGDFDHVWREHCEDQSLLSEYADAMHHLAVDHWNKHPETRIHWCRKVCLQYFHGGGLSNLFQKDERRHKYEQSEQSRAENVDATSDPAQGSSDAEDYEFVGGSSALSGQDFLIPQSPLQHFPRLRQHHNLTKLRVWKNSEGGAIYDADDEMGTVEGPRKRTPDSPDEPNGSPNPLRTRSSISRGDPNEADLPSKGDASAGLCAGSTANPAPEAKCREFMERMDLRGGGGLSSSPLPGSEEEGVPDAGEDGITPDLEAHKKALYAKYGPTKYNNITLPFEGKIRLLDVGSCFNPFLEFDEFLAVGIDISPAVESVYHCDFLHLETPEPLQLAPDTIDTVLSTLRDPVKRLPRETFHVVVFSLLLEYFPSAYQRWVCCQRAHSLLMVNGLLLIITPDSQHQNRNAPMMKSWKRALEAIGFRRCKYVKQDHLHCMAFRKVTVETQETLVGEAGPDLLYIPQDYNSMACGHDSQEIFENVARSEDENLFVRDTFLELPDLV